jgi:hypothetical protein
MKCANWECRHGKVQHQPEGCVGQVWPKTWEKGGVRPCACKKFVTAPLRKVLGIIGWKIEDRPGSAVVSHELYECGHHYRQKEDIYGPTNAYRRRCTHCANGKEPKPEFLEQAKNWPKAKV